jgi:hypothetical protein
VCRGWSSMGRKGGGEELALGRGNNTSMLEKKVQHKGSRRDFRQGYAARPRACHTEGDTKHVGGRHAAVSNVALACLRSFGKVGDTQCREVMLQTHTTGHASGVCNQVSCNGKAKCKPTKVPRALSLLLCWWFTVSSRLIMVVLQLPLRSYTAPNYRHRSHRHHDRHR